MNALRSKVSPASGAPSLPCEFEAAAAVDARLETTGVISTHSQQRPDVLDSTSLCHQKDLLTTATCRGVVGPELQPLGPEIIPQRSAHSQHHTAFLSTTHTDSPVVPSNMDL
jgi:hypothetical protein